ncbi:MAG: ABC transporter permease [Pirellulales bacterium]
MREALMLGWKDCFVRFQHKITFVFVIALPILMTLISGLAFQGFEPKNLKATIALLDEDNGLISQRLREVMERANKKDSAEDASGGADITFEFLQPAELEDARQRVAARQLGGVLILPAGTSQALEDGKPIKLDLLVNPTRNVSRSVVETAVDRLVRVAAQKDPLPLDWQSVEQGKSATATGFSSFTQAVTGNGVMFILMNCIVNGGMALVREKRQNTLARLLISPLTPGMIIFGKTFGVYIVGVIQAIVMFGFGWIVGVRPPLSAWPGMVLITSLVILVSSSLGLLISALAKREETVEAIGAPISLVLTALGGGMFPVSMGPVWMEKVSLLLPTGWAMDAYYVLLRDGKGSLAILPHAAVLAGFAFVFMFVGIRKLRWD